MSGALPGTKVHTRYYTSDGKQVPGATTVLNVLNKPHLVKWANNLGLQGIDSTKYRDKAAVIGTIAHYLIQCYFSGETPDLSEFAPADVSRAENSFLKFLEWEKCHSVEVVFAEQPLVSERFRFGGTVDAYLKLDGVLTLLDVKTSKAIWAEHLFQVASYRQLLRENGHRVDAVRVLQVGRSEEEGFSEKVLSEQEARICWRVFGHSLQIYRLRKLLDGVA